MHNFTQGPLVVRRKTKKPFKYNKGSFSGIPHAFSGHPDISKLSFKAKALIFDLSATYRGSNNGNLSITWNEFKQKGWNSQDTLRAAIKELVEAEVLLLTRQGHRQQCSLYALTFYQINECKEKFDAGIKPTDIPPNQWFWKTKK